MKARPDLPDFENPPVVEVALSVQFEALPMRAAHVGLFWSELRDRLPKVEDKSPLAHVVENMGSQLQVGIGVRLEALEAPPVPRTWFLNTAGTELVQLQSDRFVHNWRNAGKGEQYPHYESIRDSFRVELETFGRFVSREGLGDLRFDQVEVTYVNHIIGGMGWERHGQLANVCNLWSGAPANGFLGEPEDAAFSARYRIEGSDGPAGRLHVRFQPAWSTEDQTPLYVMTLTARGAPIGPGINGAMGFLDLGRMWIVEGFASITTAAMHGFWRRLDAD